MSFICRSILFFSRSNSYPFPIAKRYLDALQIVKRGTMSFGNPVDFVQKIFDESIQIKAAFIQKNAVKMTEIAELIANRILQGNKVLVCGNGGSACDASHLT